MNIKKTITVIQNSTLPVGIGPYFLPSTTVLHQSHPSMIHFKALIPDRHVTFLVTALLLRYSISHYHASEYNPAQLHLSSYPNSIYLVQTFTSCTLVRLRNSKLRLKEVRKVWCQAWHTTFVLYTALKASLYRHCKSRYAGYFSRISESWNTIESILIILLYNLLDQK